MNIVELLDLLNSAAWPLSGIISDELIEAGYIWEYSSHYDCYLLIDLIDSEYFV